MTRQTSFEDRRRRIMDIAGTDYHSSDDTATDYLAAMEGATVEEQYQLFQVVLATHDARLRGEHQCITERSIHPKEWERIARRLKSGVESWTRAMVCTNDSLEATAHSLWNLLGGFEGRDRIVALGLLLDQLAVPYARLPSELMIVQPPDVYEKAHDEVLDKVALGCRVLGATSGSIYELAEAFIRINDTIDDHTRQVVFTADFLRRLMSRAGSRRGLPQSLLELLGRGIIIGPIPFPSGGDGPDADDTDDDTDNDE